MVALAFCGGFIEEFFLVFCFAVARAMFLCVEIDGESRSDIEVLYFRCVFFWENEVFSRES
jgi:hypothetical protein